MRGRVSVLSDQNVCNRACLRFGLRSVRVRSGSGRGGRDFSGCDRELSPEQKEQACEGVSDHGEHHGELAGQLMTDWYDA